MRIATLTFEGFSELGSRIALGICTRVRKPGSAMDHVAPVGEKDEHVARAMKNIAPFLAAR